jgi:large subunit ribosomal protein L14
MKAVGAKRVAGINIGALVIAADNSGARIVRIVGKRKYKGVKGRQMSMAVGDWVKISVRKGLPEMKSQLFDAVVIRQKKPYRRLTGERICFEDNAVVLIKDEKGNPKGTMIKGAVAREVIERWPHVAKIASIVA